MLTSKHKRNNLKLDMGVQRNRNQKGFTLIEIVLVLAIAGLIFVIVFLAVQGAQRGRRDTERKAAIGRLLAAAEQVASNNRGAYPEACEDPAGFAPDDGTGAYNPGGTEDKPAYPCEDSGGVSDEYILYTDGTDCDGNNSNRFAKAEITLETGTLEYCQDNN